VTASITIIIITVHDQENTSNIIMAEVEEIREFEQVAAMATVPSESPPPPYVERSPPGNEETVLTQSVATPLIPSQGLTSTEPQLYHGNIVASLDYYPLSQFVAAFCGLFCICTLPCSIIAMVLANKVHMHSNYHTPGWLTDHQCINCTDSHGMTIVYGTLKCVDPVPSPCTSRKIMYS
jgi:hypothetical protein